MHTLFAPWRMAYISQADKIECIFCAFPREDKDEERLILVRGKECFVMLNAFPYNPGHLMIAPYRHTGNYDDLTNDELLEMNLLTQRCIKVIRDAMSPQGFNLGVNMGKVAGAGFEGHVHLHLVPRWNGDTNFMPVVGDVKVLPEALHETYRALLERWQKYE